MRNIPTPLRADGETILQNGETTMKRRKLGKSGLEVSAIGLSRHCKNGRCELGPLRFRKCRP